jgi:uncharacterized protein YcfJ
MFKNKRPPEDILSFHRIFPPKKRREIILHDVVSAIVAAITSVYSAVAGALATEIVAGITIGNVLSVVGVVGGSLLTNAVFGQKKNSDASTASNGRIFNTKSTIEPLHLHYGIQRAGRNLIIEF